MESLAPQYLEAPIPQRSDLRELLSGIEFGDGEI